MSSCVFQLQELIEIHRDPIGHYHHWSVMVGTLESGVLEQGGQLQLPTVDGSPCSATIGGFEAFRKILPSPLKAGEVSGPIGVMLTSPAPPKAIVCPGEVFAISLQQHQALIEALFLLHPERFFHRRGSVDLPCPECMRALRCIEGWKEELKALILREPEAPWIPYAKLYLGD